MIEKHRVSYTGTLIIASEVPRIEISHTNQNGKHTHTHAFLTFELIPTDIKQITTKIILQSTIYYSFIRKVKVHDKFLLPIQFTFTQPPVR